MNLCHVRLGIAWAVQRIKGASMRLSWRTAAVALCALGVAGGLAACGGSPSATSSASASSQPPPRDTTASGSSIQLARRLLATPFKTGELPSGYAIERTAYGTPQPNATEASIRLRPPSDRPAVDTIIYGLLPTAAAARALFDHGPTAVSSPANHTVTGYRELSLLGRPARLFYEHVSGVNGTGDGQGDGHFSYSYCTVLIGNIIVSGASGIPGLEPSGNSALACELARDGVQHLSETLARR